MRWIGALVALATSAGALSCTFGSSSVAGSDQLGGGQETGQDPGGSDDDDDAPVTTLDSGPDTGEGDPDSTTGDGPDPTGEPSDGAVLEFVDAPTYDFGTVAMVGADAALLVLRNTGTRAAKGITADLTGPYQFRGDRFPGSQGDCTSELEPLESCTVQIVPRPDEIGSADGRIELTYVDDSGDHDSGLDLVADVTTVELLVNANFDRCATAGAVGWDNTGMGEWICLGDTANVEPLGGMMLAGNMGPFGEEFRVRQDVDLTPFAEQIDAGTIAFSFVGNAATWGEGDDEYRILIRYIDEGDVVQETYNTGWQTGQEWAEWTDERVPPPGIRLARFVLYCVKSNGDFCDAFYDEFSFIGVAP